MKNREKVNARWNFWGDEREWDIKKKRPSWEQEHFISVISTGVKAESVTWDVVEWINLVVGKWGISTLITIFSKWYLKPLHQLMGSEQIEELLMKNQRTQNGRLVHCVLWLSEIRSHQLKVRADKLSVRNVTAGPRAGYHMMLHGMALSLHPPVREPQRRSEVQNLYYWLHSLWDILRLNSL